MSYHNSAKAEGVKPLHCDPGKLSNSLSTLAPVSIDKSACSPAGIMSPGLGPAELLRNCLLDWAPSGANKKRPPGLGPGSFLKKLQWGPVFLCQIEYGHQCWVGDCFFLSPIDGKKAGTPCLLARGCHAAAILYLTQKHRSPM